MMKLRIALAGLLVAGFVLPAAAESYWVVQDTKTKKCTISEQKPVSTEITVVGDDGVLYKSRTEAEGAMKTIKVCIADRPRFARHCHPIV